MCVIILRLDAMNSNLRYKPGKEYKGLHAAEKVIVAVKASKKIPRTALVWALTNVVQPGDSVTFLVLVPAHSSGRKLCSFPIFVGDCASRHRRSHSGITAEQKCDIDNSCYQMMLQLQDVYDPNKVNVKVKVIPYFSSGVVALESKMAQANWVVLDGQLKQEGKCCKKNLECNIVVIKHSQPKVVRLNLVGSPKTENDIRSSYLPESVGGSTQFSRDFMDHLNSICRPVVTARSSPEIGTPFTTTEAGTSSVSSSDPGSSPYIMSTRITGHKKDGSNITKESEILNMMRSATDTGGVHPLLSLEGKWCMNDNSAIGRPSQRTEGSFLRRNDHAEASKDKALLKKCYKIDRGRSKMDCRQALDLISVNIREAISLQRNSPASSPPLCSVCQHKAPAFGKPPRWFSYAELKLATGGFSRANFLAEGGYGSVHKGMLPDGQVVAVKQHKAASSQGDCEFCSEVEVLSCAQHRNVVMLIGFCIEDHRRLLVYEYICNGSLDSHLYGRRTQEPLRWDARQKIAVGAARGLRYLHEECRVGCIVHRDMRPNNILITHDFEPLVGDFGLARWQPDGDLGVETRVIGTFGYLAPEYARSGHITEKADVYSFGVVLLELAAGRKAIDINRPKGQQCLIEWARPILEEYAVGKLVDPRLDKCYSEQEVYCMLRAASLCIRQDPHTRPRMSQVLRILEGDTTDSNFISTSTRLGGGARKCG